MVTITNTHQHGLQLSNEAGETFTLGTLEAVAHLQEQLEEYLQKRGKTDYITTFHAAKLAKADGYTLKATTLNSACIRGSIPHAKKLYGRWKMPKSAFDIWYNSWKSKKDKSQ